MIKGGEEAANNGACGIPACPLFIFNRSPLVVLEVRKSSHAGILGFISFLGQLFDEQRDFGRKVGQVECGRGGFFAPILFN